MGMHPFIVEAKPLPRCRGGGVGKPWARRRKPLVAQSIGEYLLGGGFVPVPGTTSLHLDTISWTLQNVQVKGIFPVFIGGLSEESQHDEGENQSDDVHVSPLLSGGVFVLVVGRIGVLLYMIKIRKEARLVYLFLDFSRRKYQKQKRLSQLRKSLFAVKGYDSLILS